MTPVEMHDLTEKAGFEWDSLGFRDRMCFGRLVELAAAKEREAIAQQVETTEWWRAPKWQSALCPITKSTIAAAIRARGQKEGA